MGWKYGTEDGLVEVVVEPRFEGDLRFLATRRPVWIVASEVNSVAVRAIWQDGADEDLFEVSHCTLPDPGNRIANLVEILGSLDDHYGCYQGIVVHGLSAGRELQDVLSREGLAIQEICARLSLSKGTVYPWIDDIPLQRKKRVSVEAAAELMEQTA